jgi:prepilin-type N-terminal cleavage/methylation domain-containing protein
MRSLYQRGFGLVEIIVASAIIVTIMVAVTGAFQLYIKTANINGQYAQTALLTEESKEALRVLRDQGWTANIASLTLNTTYYLYWNGSQYVATTTQTYIQNNFLRTIVFTSVMRDSSFNIVPSGGTIDTYTRKVTVTISNASTTLASTDFLIHNVYNN